MNNTRQKEKTSQEPEKTPAEIQPNAIPPDCPPLTPEPLPDEEQNQPYKPSTEIFPEPNHPLIHHQKEKEKKPENTNQDDTMKEENTSMSKGTQRAGGDLLCFSLPHGRYTLAPKLGRLVRLSPIAPPDTSQKKKT